MMRELLPLALFAFAPIGCTDTLTPVDFTGTYALQAVDGERPPATLPATHEGCSVQIDAGTLTLADSAFVLYLSWVGGICPGYPGIAAAAYTYQPIGGGLTIDGDVLTLRFVNPTSPSQASVQATLSMSGADAILEIPGGTFGIGVATVWTFCRCGTT